jgi:hypothetical protein
MHSNETDKNDDKILNTLLFADGHVYLSGSNCDLKTDCISLK